MHLGTYTLEVGWHLVPPEDQRLRAVWFAQHGTKRGTFPVTLSAHYDLWLTVAATIRDDGSLWLPEPALSELRTPLAKLVRETGEAPERLSPEESRRIVTLAADALQRRIAETFIDWGRGYRPALLQELWAIVLPERKTEIEAYERAKREEEAAARALKKAGEEERERKAMELHHHARSELVALLRQLTKLPNLGVDVAFIERFEAGVLPEAELDALLLMLSFGLPEERRGAYKLDPYKRACTHDRSELRAEEWAHFQAVAKYMNDTKPNFPLLVPDIEVMAESLDGYEGDAITMNLSVEIPHLKLLHGKPVSHVAHEWILLRDFEEQEN